MGAIISKNDGLVITVPVDTWSAIHNQASRLYIRMKERREDDVLYHEDAFEKVGFATSAAENLVALLDSVKVR